MKCCLKEHHTLIPELLTKITTLTQLQIFSLTVMKVQLNLSQKSGMQITSQHRLEELFKRTLYADTFRYIQNFQPKQIGFQDISVT